MLLIRRVEEHICRVYHTDVIKSPVHLSIGQEAIAVGVCNPLRSTDAIANTYRCHATYLAKGGNLNKMMAELYGKKTGCAHGKAGSMHLIDISSGVLGASAVVGTMIPISLGYAHVYKQETKLSKSRRIIVSLFGDGATEEGCFYESINYASLHKLPILFVCENNMYAIHSPLRNRWATFDICNRVATFGIRVHQIKDNNILHLHQIVSEETHLIRQGHGPAFIECLTYRWKEHVGPNEDYDNGYRDKAELSAWRKKDPIETLSTNFTTQQLEYIDHEINSQIQEAVDFATQSPFPSQKDLLQHVYA